MSFDLSDYVDVAERERQLFERYPDARIQVDLIEVRGSSDELTGWAAKATIWRTPEDAIPVCDWAVEPVPGKTPYTKDSEAMNASTSAVGRAIVLAGFPTKKIASANEVLARQGSGERGGDTQPSEAGFSVAVTPAAASPDHPVEKARVAASAAKEARTPHDNGSPGDVVISFGKHKDERICDVPQSYIEWLVSNKFEAKNSEQRRIKAASQLYLGGETMVTASTGGGLYDDDIPFAPTVA